MIGRNGERGSRISALAARHDDDDDVFASEALTSRKNKKTNIFINKCHAYSFRPVHNSSLHNSGSTI